VIFVLCALVLVAGLIAACVVGVWRKIGRPVHDAGGKPVGPDAPGAASAPHRSPQTLEGILTLQLVAGEITGPQYRHAMATIAARDAERHPLEMPPEVTPPDAA
jgi:hypothetical protein